MIAKKDFRLKAIAAGFAIDFLSSNLMGVFIAATLSGTGVPPGDLEKHMRTTPLLLLAVILGSLTDILGGYVAGRMARGVELVNGGVVGSLFIALNLATWDKHDPAWFSVACVVLTLPFVLIGSRLAQERHAGSEPQSQPTIETTTPAPAGDPDACPFDDSRFPS